MWDQMKELCPDVTKLTEVTGPSIIPILVSTWSELMTSPNTSDSTSNMMSNSPEKIADFLRERVEAKTDKRLLPSSAPGVSDNKSAAVVASQLPGNQGMVPPMMGAGGPPMMGGKGNMPNAMSSGPPLLPGTGASNLPGMGMPGIPGATVVGGLNMLNMGAPSLPGTMMGTGAPPPRGPPLPDSTNNPLGGGQIPVMGMNQMALPPGMGGLSGQLEDALQNKINVLFSQMEAALQNKINVLQQQQAATASPMGGDMTTGAPGKKGSIKEGGNTDFQMGERRWSDYLQKLPDKSGAGGPGTGGLSAPQQSGATGPPMSTPMINLFPNESVSNSMFSANAVLPRPAAESGAAAKQPGQQQFAEGGAMEGGPTSLGAMDISPPPGLLPPPKVKDQAKM